MGTSFTELSLFKKKSNNKMEIIADYDYINGKKHSEANEANVCPQCDKFKSESKASRRDHYVRHHYDIYYSMVRESQFIEGWLNRILGHAKLGGRRCLHCNGSRSHTGRLRLLKHMQTAHPDNFSALRTEYAAVPHIGKVKDKMLHQLLTGQHLHRNNPAKNIVAKHKNKSLQNNSTTAPANLPLAIANASLPALPFAENQSSANLVWPNIVTTEFMAQIMPVIYCLQPLSIIPAYLITPQFVEPSLAVQSQPNTVPYCTQYGLQIVNY